MYVSGIASATRLPSMCTSSTSARSLPLRSRPPCRVASSSTTSAPTLCFVRVYSSPGLPRPTTSRSAGVPVRGGAAAPRRRRSTRYSPLPSSPSDEPVSDAASGAPSPSAASPSTPSSPSTSSGTSSSTTRGATTCATSVVGLDGRGDAGRQRQLGEAELVADLERRDVVLDPGRDVLRLGLDRQREDELLEDAAVAHAGGLAGEVEADLRRHGHVGAHPHEVDVDEVAAGRVALDLPGQRQGLVAVDLQRDQRVRALGEDVHELAGRHRDGQRVGPQAVDDGGNLARRRSRPAGREPRSARGSAVRVMSSAMGPSILVAGGTYGQVATCSGVAESPLARLSDAKTPSDVVAAEDLADRGVLEDGVERLGEDRRDRQHGQRVEALLVGDRQRCW